MAVLGIGLAAAGVSGISPLASMLGLAIGFVLMLPGHALGATGAGDVKLMAAIGAIVGPVLAVKAFLFTALAGGVLAVLVALARGRLGATVAGTARLATGPAAAKQKIAAAGSSSRFAYAPAIAAGSIVAALIG